MLIAYPAVSDLPFTHSVPAVDLTGAALIIGLAAVALGILMSSTSTFLYRLLEGYNWPIGALRRMRERRHVTLRANLKRRAYACSPGSIDEALLFEQYHRYPPDGPTAATRFGNAMRSAETYGWDRWRLESQTLWTHLLAVVPETVRTEMETARGGVSLWVSVFFNLLLFSAACIASALTAGRLGHPDNEVLIVGVATLVLLVPVYRGAVTATTNVRSAVQALVDEGRAPLAQSFGLSIPSTVADERHMWEVVSSFTFHEYSQVRADRLTQVRSPSPPNRAPTLPLWRLTLLLILVRIRRRRPPPNV